MKEFVTQMGLFNTVVAVLVAVVPTSLGLKKSSPEIVIVSFLILLIIFLIGMLINTRQELNSKKEEFITFKKSYDIEVEKLIDNHDKKVDDLKKFNEELTFYKEFSAKKISKYEEYFHERNVFVEIELMDIKQYFDDIFDEVQKWQTAIRNDMSDADKDAFISLSKREIAKKIGDERRKNYDDRKGL